MIRDHLSLGGYLVLTNVGATYDAIAPSRGLGMALVDFLGVDSIDFRVSVNKVGTGTQSWQLWNVTDGTEIGVIDDAGASTEKVLQTTISGASIPSGTKLVRVRAKSTTAADDPVYYGATLLLRLAPMTFERLGLAEQFTRNIYQLTGNWRANATGYKSQIAGGKPAAEVAATMLADAAQYLIRLGWITSAVQSNQTLCTRVFADYGVALSSVTALRDSLVAIAEHTQAASLTTGAEINTESDYILANVPDYLRLW